MYSIEVFFFLLNKNSESWRSGLLEKYTTLIDTVGRIPVGVGLKFIQLIRLKEVSIY